MDELSIGELKKVAASNIAERLENYVYEHNTTKESVAQAIGCSRTALYQKISGNSTFTLFEGYLLSRMFGCDVTDFFTIPASA